jgi:aminoglycoside phosphotransferase (APT) family kinase protein
MDTTKPWYERRHELPDERTLQWVERSVAPGGTVDAVEFLPGGSSSAIHRVTLKRPDGEVLPVVLRRWIRPDWRETEAYLSPERESRALRLAEAHALAAPRLLALDEEGTTGLPALVMSNVEGGARDRKPMTSAELASMARAIAAVHAVRLRDELPDFHFYNRGLADTRPKECTDEQLWRDVFALARDGAHRPYTPDRFVHRDFNPGNVLWTGETVSGLVDWGSASKGMAASDIGHMRWNLAVLHDVATADAFLDAYRAETPDYVHDPYWDLRAVTDLFPESPSHSFDAPTVAAMETYLRGVVAALR